MAKYHLGKVKLERVGQRSSQYVTNGAAHKELQGSLCALLLVLLCIVALLADCSASILPSCESLRILADHSGSIFAFLEIIGDFCPLSSLPPGGFVSIFSSKHSLR